ncbi:MAG: hypothetical protein DRQ98_11720, partial [Gammaproteobacteria bacterium]
KRHYWMGQPRPLFTKMSVISQVTGLDNSHILPPYFPVFRGEDYLFGAMVEYLHPQAAVLEYDWCVPHFPLEARRGGTDNKPATGKGGINLSKYVTDHTLYEPGISAQTRLNSLTVLIRELAETSDQGLLTLYRTEVAEEQGRQLKALTAKLQDGTPRPQAWQAYLQQSQAGVNEAMQSVARLKDIPSIPDTYEEQTILDEFRDSAGEFAVALEGWAAIREAAKGITDEMLATDVFIP